MIFVWQPIILYINARMRLTVFHQENDHNVVHILSITLFFRPRRTSAFIRNALETRLRMIIPYADTWPQAMALTAIPSNTLEHFSNLSQLMDDIWYYAGDRSADVSILYFVSPREWLWCHRVVQNKKLVIARATCAFLTRSKRNPEIDVQRIGCVLQHLSFDTRVTPRSFSRWDESIESRCLT